MIILENFSLLGLNTFRIDVSAKYFINIETENQLESLLQNPIQIHKPVLFIGGGSNVLFTKNFDGTVLKYSAKGIQIILESKNEVFVEAQAGECWDDLVAFCVSNNFYGIENLSLIPGNVGAAPIQNIGAYGAELKDVFEYLEGYNLESAKKQIFRKTDCRFGYRDSIFKREFKGNFLITKVVLKLSKERKFNLTYNALKDELSNLSNGSLTLQSIRDTVIRIRENKLPNPKQIGNAGSFFKNPEIDYTLFSDLKVKHNDMPSFIINEDCYKIPAGWLIQKCGFRGKRIGNVGSFEKQALVVINYGDAKGDEILSYAEMIRNEVYKKFGIQLEYEVNII